MSYPSKNEKDEATATIYNDAPASIVGKQCMSMPTQRLLSVAQEIRPGSELFFWNADGQYSSVTVDTVKQWDVELRYDVYRDLDAPAVKFAPKQAAAAALWWPTYAAWSRSASTCEADGVSSTARAS